MQQNSSFFLFVVACIVLLSTIGTATSTHTPYTRQGVVVMLGHIVENEARIWVQTKTPARTSISYKPVAGQLGAVTDDHFTTSEHGNAYTFTLPFLTSNTEYEYNVNVEGVIRAQGTFVTPPTLETLDTMPNISFVMGSCAYLLDARLGEEGGEHHTQIFNSMAAEEPSVVLWMGDNVYLRSPDLTSYSGFINRYTHMRNHDSIQELLQCAPNIAVWDDHDFGANNSVGSAPYGDMSLQAFQNFWANPESNFGRQHGCITASYRYMDVEVFLLDNRMFRQLPSAYGDSAAVFGKAQIDWLKENILASFASVKIIVSGGQILNTFAEFENHSRYKQEHEFLMSTLRELADNDVLIVSGDRHFSEVTRLIGHQGDTLVDCTVSPLTSSAWATPTDVNPDRVEGSLVTERNYAVLSISGPYQHRSVEIHYKNVTGESVYSLKLQ